jgi:hypothetical protein
MINLSSSVFLFRIVRQCSEGGELTASLAASAMIEPAAEPSAELSIVFGLSLSLPPILSPAASCEVDAIFAIQTRTHTCDCRTMFPDKYNRKLKSPKYCAKIIKMGMAG